MKSFYIHCGRINISFTFTEEKPEEILAILEMAKFFTEDKSCMPEFIREAIDQVREKLRWDEKAQEETDYALDHDEFWFELTDHDEFHMLDNINKEVDPSARYHNIKDKLDSNRFLRN